MHPWRWWHWTCALSQKPLFWVTHYSPSVVALSTSGPAGVCRINRWTTNSAEQAEPTENYHYAFLTFYRHNDDLEMFEEVWKPERFIQALDHAGFFNPYTMRVSKWYQKTTLKGDVSHFSSFSRTSDTCLETSLTKEREPAEDDEDRLATKIGDMLLPLPRRFSNPRISRRPGMKRFFFFLQNSYKMHRAASVDVYTQAWFD